MTADTTPSPRVSLALAAVCLAFALSSGLAGNGFAALAFLATAATWAYAAACERLIRTQRELIAAMEAERDLATWLNGRRRWWEQ